MNRLLSSAALLGVLLLGATARADLPPPNGTKFVGYEFVVKGVAGGETALLAFPCSSSNGFPATEAKKVSDGTPISVGRRGGDCKLYAASAADWDALAPSVAEGRPGREAALRAFFESKAKRCEGASPSMQGTLPKTDPRDVVRETLEVMALSKTACRIAPVTAAVTAGSAAPSASAAPSTGAAPTSAPSASASAPAVPTAGGAPPARTGCAATPGRARDAAGFAGLAIVLGVLARRARRRAR